MHKVGTTQRKTMAAPSVTFEAHENGDASCWSIARLVRLIHGSLT